MASKIDSKTKRELTWGIIRTQGAANSKNDSGEQATNIDLETQNLEMLAPLLEPIADKLSLAGVLFATCFKEPLGGNPWTDFEVPWGALGPIWSLC